MNSRINERIKLNYQDDGYIATVTVNMKNRHVLTFKCWEEFIQHKWTETSSINSISLQWNFNIRIPGCIDPQMHNLIVKLSNGLRPEEMLNLIFSGNIEDFDDIELNTLPIVARVDFIQAVLGEELLDIVEKWVNGLSRNSDIKNPFILLMRKFRKRVAQYFEYISFIMMFVLVVCSEVWWTNRLNVKMISDLSMNQFNSIIISISIGILFMFLSKILFENIARDIYDKLSDYGNVYIFKITKGDLQKQTDIQNKDKSNGKRILINFILSLIFNVTCGIISALIV